MSVLIWGNGKTREATEKPSLCKNQHCTCTQLILYRCISKYSAHFEIWTYMYVPFKGWQIKWLYQTVSTRALRSESLVNPFTTRVDDIWSLWGGYNFYACGQHPMVRPFKWNLFGSTFMWCYLTCFKKIYKMKFGIFLKFAFAYLAVKGLIGSV